MAVEVALHLAEADHPQAEVDHLLEEETVQEADNKI